MATTLNTKIVNDTFNKEYNEMQFKLFIKDLLADADFTKEGQIQLPAEYREFIKSAKRICKYKYSTSEFDENILTVLAVKLKRTTSIDRARTAQRNFVARYLNGSRGYITDAALVAFYSEDENGNISPDWRFSLVQMNYVTKFVETTTGKKKLKTEVELTPAKRFSFLVGANEDTHTAQAQFKSCLDKASNNEKITIEDLVAAFDIEKVSKEFFDKYKNLYLKIYNELQKLCDVDEIVRSDFETHNVNIDDFAKKTLGQLVFLYFIQKKGWLGVDRDKNWGTGDKKFLRNLFEGKYGSYNNFFNDILEHLFYEALASDRGPSAWFDKLNCRIPFLNGGLFEPVNGYEYQKTDLTIDNNLFKEIFDTFDLYNFTVKEDEPLEKEVAIDPEMLGKVFENLLPENIRKGNGAFYTPREIVHYMCQESLINYLYNKLNIKEVELSPEEKAEQQSLFKKKKISQLKLTKEVIEEILSKEDIEHLIKKGCSNYSNKTVKEEMPSKVVEYARVLDKALCEIKVCDPAIGSGAFPVGMMNEIVRARAALSVYIDQPNRSIYELKRNAIENSIYGVDIDGGAVEIAKLRFWLSLVVDEEDIKNIKPLPNLDYKIMQGNSLITSYEGIDFDEIVDEYKPNTQLTINLWGDRSQDLKLELKNKQSEFLKTPYATRKIELKKEIEDIIINIVKAKLEIKAKEGKLNLHEMEDKIRNFAQNTENRNFFPWKLFFSDAFDNGGFDIVIGNPPYITLALGKGQDYFTKEEVNLYKKLYPNSVEYKGNTYAIFYDKAIDLIKNNGCVSYITPNTLLLSNSYKNLRKLILNKTKIINLVNFKKTVFESAETGGDLILLLQQSNANDNTLKIVCVDDFKTNKNLESYKQNILKQEKFNTNFNYNFSTDNDEKTDLIGKICNSNTELLGTIVKFYQGIITGNNDKFIANSKITNQHLPILRGKDINKYHLKFNNNYVLFDKNQLWSNTNEDNFYTDEKLINRQTGDSLVATYDNSKYLTLDSTHVQTLKNQKYKLKYILALFNSKLLNFVYTSFVQEAGRTFAQVKTVTLKQLPIKVSTNEIQNKFVEIVDSILNLTQNDDYQENIEKQQAVKEYENQIDIMVYKLYGLTYQEVLTVDKDFSMSEEEYNNYKL